MFDAEPVYIKERFICYPYEKEADHESISERQLIREMQPMPQEIQLISIEAEEHEQHEYSVQRFFSESHFLIQRIEHQQYHYDHAAVKIRKPFSKCQISIRQQLVDHIESIIIYLPLIRHLRRYIIRALHADIRRKQHHISHDHPKERVAYSLSCSSRAHFHTASANFDKVQHRIIKHDEYAYHYGHVIVGEHYQCQRHHIHDCSAVIDQPIKTQYAKRQKCYGIYPHDAPVICHNI